MLGGLPILGLRDPARPDDRLDLAKIIAIVLMAANHVLLAFPADWAHLGHWLGRPCIPLFAYIMLARLRDGPPERSLRMLQRLLVWGLIAQPPYGALLGGLLVRLNVLFTLATGAVLIHLLKRGQTLFAGVMMILLVVVDPALDGGALTPFGQVAGFYAWPVSPLLALVLMTSAAALNNLLLLPSDWIAVLATFAAIPIVLASRVAPGLPFRVPGIVFYAFYPAHLAVIWIAFGPYPRL